MKDSRHVAATYGLIRSKSNPAAFKMPLGGGHYFASPNSAYWGIISLILFLKDLSWKWETLEPHHPFGIGDIGWEDFTGVHSHPETHRGAAVDIYVIHKDGLRRSDGHITGFGDEKYDDKRTLRLAKTIQQTQIGRASCRERV